MDAHMRLKLVSTLTEYDRKESTKKYHNRFALGIYLQSLHSAEDDIKEGSSLARALYDHFNGRLLTALEKAAGVPVTYGGGGHDRGRPA
jgi:hypothetical protein